MLSVEAKHINLIDPAGMQTHNLPHSTRDSIHYTTDVVPGITLLIVITVKKNKKNTYLQYVIQGTLTNEDVAIYYPI